MSAWRYLKGNKSTYGPVGVICVDTETTSVPETDNPNIRREVFRLGVARRLRFEQGRPTRRGEIVFFDTADFWQFVAAAARKRETLWVFAHGMGFDLRVLGWQREIDSGRLVLRRRRRVSNTINRGDEIEPGRDALICLDDPPTIIDSYTIDGRTIRFVDTRNYWRCSLAELGSQLSLPKHPMPEPWDSEPDWITYCQRDCEIVERAVCDLVAWHREHDLGVWKPTIAGIAFQAFKHRFQRTKLVIHDEADVAALERRAYYGGQISSYYFGHIGPPEHQQRGLLFDKFHEDAPKPVGPVHQLDTNSLYPSVMREYLFPKRLLEWRFFDEPQDVSSIRCPSDSVADVFVSTANQDFPIRTAGGVRFARGDYRTVLAGPELYRAASAGLIRRVYSTARYELADLFSSFVDYFWQLRWMNRLAGNLPYEGLCKLALNSLYGKFGQKSVPWVNRPAIYAHERWQHWNKIDASTRTIREFRSIGPLVQERVPQGDAGHAFVAIPAFVTAYAREQMRRDRETAGHHNVYYQAVDALYVSDLGLERLQAAGRIDPARLGALRLEATASDADFLGGGYYRIGSRWVRSSVYGGSVQVDWDTWRAERMQRLESGLTCGDQPGVRVTTDKVVKRPTLPTEGATINGWVRPCVIIESQDTQSINPADCVSDARPSASTWLAGGGS